MLQTTSDGLRFVGTRDPGLRLPSLPSGLLTKPTLEWKVAAERPGRRRVRTTYQTGGLTWRADYSLFLPICDMITWKGFRAARQVFAFKQFRDSSTSLGMTQG